MRPIVNYCTYLVLAVSLAGHYLRHNSTKGIDPVLMHWTRAEFQEELKDYAGRISLHLESFGFVSIEEVARFDSSIVNLEGFDLKDSSDQQSYLFRVAMGRIPLVFEQAHHHIFHRLATNLAIIFVPGIFSIVAIEEEDEPATLVIGRGTFVGVPIVVFALGGEIVHVTNSNANALDYFIEHWQ